MGTVNEKFTYLDGTKTAIKNAIVARGIAVETTDTFRSYASKINSIGQISAKNASALIRPTSLTQGTGYTAWTIPTDNSIVSDSFSTAVTFTVMATIGYFWITLDGVNSIVPVPANYQSTELPFFARFITTSASGLTITAKSTTAQLSNVLNINGITNPESFTPSIIEVSGILSNIFTSTHTLSLHKLYVRFINEVV